MDANTLSKVKEFVGSAQNIFIATHEHPTPDSIGSSLALMLGLASLGKKVTLACPDPVTVALSDFVGVDKIQADVEKKNFIISLDYVDGSIEKVSYNIEGDKFNLVIEPRPGFESLTQDKVHYSYAGAAADVIITIDTIHLGGLKKLYDNDKDLYTSKPVINIDRHPNNSQYGGVNVTDSSVSATAELVGRVLSFLGVRLSEDIATNILNALIGSTNNFQNPGVGAGTFELVAACLKAGGTRFSTVVGGTGELPQVTSSIPSTPVQKSNQNQSSVPQNQIPLTLQPSQLPVSSIGQTSQSTVSASSQIARPPVNPVGQASQDVSRQAPADWLKPKIFKSSNLS